MCQFLLVERLDAPKVYIAQPERTECDGSTDIRDACRVTACLRYVLNARVRGTTVVQLDVTIALIASLQGRQAPAAKNDSYFRTQSNSITVFRQVCHVIAVSAHY